MEEILANSDQQSPLGERLSAKFYMYHTAAMVRSCAAGSMKQQRLHQHDSATPDIADNLPLGRPINVLGAVYPVGMRPRHDPESSVRLIGVVQVNPDRKIIFQDFQWRLNRKLPLFDSPWPKAGIITFFVDRDGKVLVIRHKPVRLFWLIEIDRFNDKVIVSEKPVNQMAKPLIHNLKLNLRNFFYKLPDCEQVTTLTKCITVSIGIGNGLQQHFNFVTSKNLIDHKKAIAGELALDVVIVGHRYLWVDLQQSKRNMLLQKIQTTSIFLRYRKRFRGFPLHNYSRMLSRQTRKPACKYPGS